MKMTLKESVGDLDLDQLRTCFTKIAELRKITRGMRKDDPVRSVVETRLTALRMEAKESGTLLFEVFARGKRGIEYYEVFTEYPGIHDLMGFKTEFKQAIQATRKKQRLITPEVKDVIGYRYSTVGGVLTEPEVFKKLKEKTDPISRIRAPKAPAARSKNKYIGIEIELIARCDRETLNHELIVNGLAGYVRVDRDGSIQIESPGDFVHEIMVMCRQEDVKKIVTRIHEVLSKPHVGAYVNSSCGLHVHLDCRNRDHKAVYKNLVNCLPVLMGMVPPERVTGEAARRYCQQNRSDDFDRHGTGHDDRYQMVNAVSYGKYKTIEVRLHSGSTNPVKIVNWAALLVAIAESARPITTKVNTAAELGAILGLPAKLIAYVERRTELFSKKTIKDTRDDHFSPINFEMAA